MGGVNVSAGSEQTQDEVAMVLVCMTGVVESHETTGPPCKYALHAGREDFSGLVLPSG